MDYKSTLNLPKTKFPMQAGLPKREPTMLQEWNQDHIYEKVMKKNEGKPVFVLHDGPPYANGDIHLGTALNKVLKDIIVRYKNMSGFQAPYVPGWDTHGLPTELKARKKAGVGNSTTISNLELRKLCREFALGYLNDQRKEFRRLGGIGDWEHPYVTLTHDFEAKQIEIFSNMATKGLIYRGLKPVYWCPECKTALAEAEIEYAEDPCDSIFVKFHVIDDKGLFTAKGADLSHTYFVIWTTTTWTIPANEAICLGPDFEYSLIQCGEDYYVMASALYENVMAQAGLTDYKVVATFKGSDLELIKTQHPFLDRVSPIILGNHVTLESGTGCVHTAPGHGIDDYNVCQNYPDLPIIVPVDANGYLTSEAGERFAGLSTKEANKAIADYLVEIGAMFATQKIIHQYPHCWRCKNPVLFRATEQWFCSVDAIKDQAVEEINKVKWIPEWGRDRITSMVRERNDWCISRQRRWGVPIPIFYCKDCGEPLISAEAMKRVSDLFREKGSDAWYELSAEEILPEGTKCAKCGCGEFTKESDIMDVWFDSGVTHAAVADQRPELHWPADLYLEGADQYRGWFQSSLLTSVAWRGKAPYKAVCTHGWVVDGEGRKMSKSLGNGINPQEIVDQYGADILRLWVASSDYHADIRISKEILKQLSDAYRKIRNTARFILGNLSDFDPDHDMVPMNELEDLDRWALIKFDELIKKTVEGYETLEFHNAYHAIHNFCVVDMSNFYLDVCKDRLYTEKAESHTRRAAQTVMFLILSGMTRLVSPILAFTSDEIWHSIPHLASEDADNVVLNEFPQPSGIKVDETFLAKWDRIHEIRDDVKKALELARKEKVIGSSLDAKVQLFCDGDLYDFVNEQKKELLTALIVSQLETVKGGSGEFTEVALPGLSITVKHAEGQKCARCWVYSDEVGKNADHPDLCERCAHVIG
ncbi:MAG: isoleucine--tRNA ligase [Clostridiales bacterium]|jgi:isoleucyl-tRNA synthetase|nr:isoleucine--tRNA ligase [Clostridiales bacterium]MCI2161553.1 isoleucine--tRNA ligase [Oscillospiraceae bacterium]MCI1960357.1 isoleucine--tRNA ligase [Clostridiales bacterium]MCI2020844.1 isoleucine--tRNA ligase [Clostridiales bacterium]MCI2025227.1 isoleucine--tRNA ligase [Clostridiales bacterium]